MDVYLKDHDFEPLKDQDGDGYRKKFSWKQFNRLQIYDLVLKLARLYIFCFKCNQLWFSRFSELTMEDYSAWLEKFQAAIKMWVKISGNKEQKAELYEKIKPYAEAKIEDENESTFSMHWQNNKINCCNTVINYMPVKKQLVRKKLNFV